MDFLPRIIEDYAQMHTTPEADVLKELSRATYLKHLNPRMLSGHLQGKILSTFVHMLAPKRVLEIGTFTGYSAICMAGALPPGGKLITIDVDEELEPIVREYIGKAGLNEKIDFIVGEAIRVIPQLNESFDLVFIDADKPNYLAYYHLVKPMVRKGGFIIADNVLWSGKVVGAVDPKDEETTALKEFSQFITTDSDVENLLMPVRDGLMICRVL